MKNRDAPRHPGPFRIMRTDTEFTGILIAVGFVIMGLVALPIAKWFLLGTVAIGVLIAVLLRVLRKSQDSQL